MVGVSLCGDVLHIYKVYPHGLVCRLRSGGAWSKGGASFKEANIIHEAGVFPHFAPFKVVEIPHQC